MCENPNKKCPKAHPNTGKPQGKCGKRYWKTLRKLAMRTPGGKKMPPESAGKPRGKVCPKAHPNTGKPQGKCGKRYWKPLRKLAMRTPGGKKMLPESAGKPQQKVSKSPPKYWKMALWMFDYSFWGRVGKWQNISCMFNVM